MQGIDYFFIILFIVLNTVCFVLSLIPPNEGLKVVGDWIVMLTHLLAVPSLILVSHTRWYCIVLVYSVMTSVLYHLSKIGYYGLFEYFDRWDVAAQNVLIMSTFFLLVYEYIPEWAFLLIAGSGVFMGAMGEAQVGTWKIFEIVSAVMFALLLLYLMYRTCKPVDIRDNVYIGMACACAVVASISFIVAGEMDPQKYGFVHSIWHCSAYIMLYFALKSIKNPYHQLRDESVA